MLLSDWSLSARDSPPPHLDDDDDVAGGKQPGQQMDGLHVDAVLGGGKIRRIFSVVMDQAVQDGDGKHRLRGEERKNGGLILWEEEEEAEEV